ncbi:hypothetical protein MNBD_PLANCTO03-2041, partial [hydrothermal vent metagenome]
LNLRAFGMVALAMMVLGATGWGVAVVHARAGELLASQPTRVEIAWPMLPDAEETWMGKALREQITAMVEAQLAGRSLDAGALAAVGEMLEASGWFDEKPRIVRTGDASLGIAGTWREPACVLRSGERDYPLDWQGRPFPIDYPAGASGMRVIVGAASSPPVDGRGVLNVLDPWPGEDVAAGLELLGPLLGEPFAAQVAGVDVSGYFTQGQLAIVTDRETRVVWGGRYDEFIPGEATTEQKLARLRSAASNPLFERRIDSGADRLDISGEHLILDRTRQP